MGNRQEHLEPRFIIGHSPFLVVTPHIFRALYAFPSAFTFLISFEPNNISVFFGPNNNHSSHEHSSYLLEFTRKIRYVVPTNPVSIKNSINLCF